MKKVSILIVAFDPGLYFRASLESILMQTYKNTEILILDNASEEDIRTHFPTDSGKIKLYRSERNLGPYGGLNYLLDRATGDYIAIQDHDDIWHPEKLTKQVEFLEHHSDFVGSGTNTIMYYEWDNKYFEYQFPAESYYTVHPSLIFRSNPSLRYDTNHENYFKDALFQKSTLCHGEKRIYNLKEPLTLHIIKPSCKNLSYKWYTFSWRNIRRSYSIHPLWYATATIGWEALRKIFYPLLSVCRLWYLIDTIERIPFKILGYKVQWIENLANPMKWYIPQIFKTEWLLPRFIGIPEE